MGRQEAQEAVARLAPLVGTWDMWALPDGERMGPVRTSFAWVEGEAFLLQRSELAPGAAVPDNWRGHLPFPVVAMIGYDDTERRYTMLYRDGRGVRRVYGFSLDGGEWRMWRSAPGFHQRFTARFDEAGDRALGAWEMSQDGVVWRTDFPVEFDRTG